MSLIPVHVGDVTVFMTDRELAELTAIREARLRGEPRIPARHKIPPEMRKAIEEAKGPQKEIAERFGLPTSTVGKIQCKAKRQLER